jgi:hypothetical protein
MGRQHPDRITLPACSITDDVCAVDRFVPVGAAVLHGQPSRLLDLTLGGQAPVVQLDADLIRGHFSQMDFRRHGNLLTNLEDGSRRGCQFLDLQIIPVGKELLLVGGKISTKAARVGIKGFGAGQRWHIEALRVLCEHPVRTKSFADLPHGCLHTTDPLSRETIHAARVEKRDDLPFQQVIECLALHFVLESLVLVLFSPADSPADLSRVRFVPPAVEH